MFVVHKYNGNLENTDPAEVHSRHFKIITIVIIT